MRNILVTAEWLKSRIEKREERIRNEGITEGQDQVLRLLDEEARKEIESELRHNGNSDSKD